MTTPTRRPPRSKLKDSTRHPVPPPPGHSFRKDSDPPELADELERLRHDEWKHTSVGDGRGAAERAQVRMALLRGYQAGLRSTVPLLRQTIATFAVDGEDILGSREVIRRLRQAVKIAESEGRERER